MLRKLFRRRREPTGTEARVPANTRIYAIGDIHGRLDLLRELHGKIVADGKSFSGTKKIVYIGDYVDRGLESRGVIECLCGEAPEGFERIFLKGNHDDWLLRFLDDCSAGPPWLYNGGDATLYSYGVGVEADWLATEPKPDQLEHMQKALNDALPAHHRAFLEGLKLYQIEGDYFFVHAGIRPRVPLEEQDPEDLLWIRDDFLHSADNHGKVVVHGHTPSGVLEVLDNRIGIDTGAYFSGVLSCMILEDDRRRVLQTGMTAEVPLEA